MSLDHDESDIFSFAMTISSAGIVPGILNVVMDLGVLNIINSKVGYNGFMSPVEIAAELPTTNPAPAASVLDRMLRLLASHGVLTCTLRCVEEKPVERMYGLGPVCKFLTDDKDGLSLHGLLQMLQQSLLFTPDRECFKKAVLTGELPMTNKLGMSWFEYLAINPELSSVFNAGMESHSTIMMKKLLQNYHGFDGVSCLIDIGGNTGSMLNMILMEYPSIKGINFDLPHVIKDAPIYPGVEHVGGDMFMSVPKGDAIFMKYILHDWSDNDCNKILNNCYDALSDNGKIIVFEHIMPEDIESTNATRSVTHMDLLMWAGTGGRERTEKEFQHLAKEAGFQGFKLASSAYDMKVMEFLKISSV